MIQNTNYGTSKSYVDTNIGVWNWSATRTYSSGDIVSYSGILYVSLQNNNTNQIPSSATTYWGVYNKSGSADVGTDLKPIKMVGGVPTAVANNLVSTTGAQTIAGTKTFSSIVAEGNNAFNLRYDGVSGHYAVTVQNTTLEKNVAPTNNNYPFYLRIMDKNGARINEPMGVRINSGQTEGLTFISAPKMNGQTDEDLRVYPGYITASTRGYNASNTSDVATIGTLDAYTPMVRTTGNQSIDGIKKFSTPTLSKFKGLSLTDGWFKIIEFTTGGSPLTSAVFVADRNNSQFGILVMVTQSSGNWSIKQIAGNLDPANFRLARKADRTKGYLFHNGGRISTNLIFANYAWMNESMCDTADYIVPTDTNAYAEPTVGDDWQSVVTWS